MNGIVFVSAACTKSTISTCSSAKPVNVYTYRYVFKVKNSTYYFCKRIDYKFSIKLISRLSKSNLKLYKFLKLSG